MKRTLRSKVFMLHSGTEGGQKTERLKMKLYAQRYFHNKLHYRATKLSLHCFAGQRCHHYTL